MGALRSAVKRKTHKERAQPLARRKHGLLEKKKDYRLRAQDFHKKEKTLQVLRKKAEERNPDEFYFAMQREQTKDGVHLKESSTPNKYTQQELRLMKTQDLKFVALKAQTEAKKLARLRERLHLVGAPAEPRHTVFVDAPAELRSFSAAAHLDTPPELLTRAHNRPRHRQLEAPGACPQPMKGQEAKLARYKATAYKELEERTERHRKLTEVAEEMSQRKELMGGGAVRKLRPKEEGGKCTYKWRLERKK